MIYNYILNFLAHDLHTCITVFFSVLHASICNEGLPRVSLLLETSILSLLHNHVYLLFQ